MSMPLRPPDSQLTNIIDKLAKFVAKNGPEFAEMTRQKQKDNQQFAFLHPSNEFNNYFNYKVMEERRAQSGKNY
jgi:calcium homeostasis endoplasmic reticulum protein